MLNKRIEAKHTMPSHVALQLYTLTQALAKDFAGVLRRVAALGYAGVETAGFPGATPSAVARLCNELGLTVCAAHNPLPLGDQKQEVLDTMGALGCQRLICPGQAPEYFNTPDGIRRMCETLNEANTVARAHGLTLGYHNHWQEFLPVPGDGRLAYQFLLEHLSPDIFLEIDTYWVKTAGVDPAAVLREIGRRAPLLHIKDGPAVQEAPMTAVGAGVLDWPAVAEASSAEWWIVELDRCATDIWEALQQSYTYLTGMRFVRGKR